MEVNVNLHGCEVKCSSDNMDYLRKGRNLPYKWLILY